MIVEFANFYVDGGPFMFPILALGVATIAMMVMTIVTAEKVFSVFSQGGIAMTFAIGLGGTVLGFAEAISAAGGAPMDQAPIMLLAAGAIGLNTLITSMVFAVIHLPLAGLMFTRLGFANEPKS